MNTIGKKIAAGTVAAAFLLGGAGLYYTQAYAADTAADTSVTDGSSEAQKPNGQHGFGKRGNREGGEQGFERGGRGGFGMKGGIIEETATVLGVEASVIQSELQQQKTLAQIAQEKAGLSEEAFVQKLVEAETQKLDDAVSAGTITQEQADKHKTDLADRLKQAVNGTGKGPGGFFGGKGGHGGHGGFGMFGNPESLSTLLGITQQELTSALQQGKSLSEIAQEKGISQDQLIAKLKENMDEALKQFVERKHDGQTPPASSAAPAPAESAPAAASGA